MLNVISWNTRGQGLSRINEVYDWLFNPEHNNVMMIQEAGVVEHSDGVPFSVTFGRRDKTHYDFMGCFAGQAGAKNPRCTTGMLVEKNFITIEGIFPYVSSIGRRPILCCHCVDNDEHKYALATVHSTANEGIAREELIEINNAFRQQYAGTVYEWLVIGDLNCDAYSVKDDRNIIFIYPPTATHECGKTLDFAICSSYDLKNRTSIKLGGAGGSSQVPAASDHFPIYCEIQ